MLTCRDCQVVFETPMKLAAHRRQHQGVIKVQDPTFGFENVHPSSACRGEFCAFHNPSSHHMREWALQIRESGLLERTCPHGIGHPDPDSLAWIRGVYEQEGRGREGEAFGIHGCDGCCATPTLCPKCFSVDDPGHSC